MVRAAQKEFHRQEQQEMTQMLADNLAGTELGKEVAALAALRELNPEAYEIAVQAIMKKYTGKQ